MSASLGKIQRLLRSHRWAIRVGLAVVIVLGTGFTARAIVTNLNVVAAIHAPAAEHADQFEFTNLVAGGQRLEAFQAAFEDGDELFETKFNAVDGGGANVGNGERYTRVPRADLNRAGQWATHTPARATGPNAQACNECHLVPGDDGSGGPSTNAHRDPGHTGIVGRFIQRNTPSLFGLGALQRLAEEMTTDLQSIRNQAVAQARARGRDVSATLTSKGVNFGTIVADVGRGGNVSLNTSGVRGVDPDLVVKPYQWKGSVATVRAFARDAANNEIGMQGVEFVGDNIDGDSDGVANELSVGDITALTVYNAAQPRPTTKIELASLGLIPALSAEEQASIAAGETVFDRTRCGSCHVKSMVLNNPIFSEPSQNTNYRDAVFPAGQNPVARGVDPRNPITIDLTRDQPDNHIALPSGGFLGSLEKDRAGHGIVRLFSDLKRHDMGNGLAESIDEVGTGRSVFLTRTLWGVGTTAPYLHDGRATTLTEAILEHGGEAGNARSDFLSLSTDDQQNLVAFLDNLVLFKKE